MHQTRNLRTRLWIVAICLLATVDARATVLEITARHDRPGPVEILVESFDGGGALLVSSPLSWGNDDNNWGVQSMTVPSATRTVRMTFVNDFFGAPDPDQDRNAYIDFFTVDGEKREAESFDLTGGTDPQFPGCSVGMLDGRTVAECGNQNDFVEYLVIPRIWKADHPNYAPSGMPDFDQRQDQWAQQILCGPNLNPDSPPLGDDVLLGVVPPCSSPDEPVIGTGPDGVMNTPLAGDDVYRYDYCAPAALANCLWWFDSRFEADPAGTPCDGNDTYDLVTSYPPVTRDDHCPNNVDDPSTPPGGVPPAPDTAFGELIEDLAWRMDTGGQRTGVPHGGSTSSDMKTAIEQYLKERNLQDQYFVTLVQAPGFEFLAKEVRRSQDLILGLSFVQNCQGQLQFVGGHAVTVAGVDPDPNDQQLCLSDPYFDMAELGSSGRVRPPGPHGHTGPPETVHNDALFVSHDCNPVRPTAGPFGTINLPGFANVVDETGFFEETTCRDIVNFFGQNSWDPQDPKFEPFPCDPSCTLETVVSFALEISPFFWKASGLPDYAPSGVPDFDQKQDTFVCPVDGTWSYCGPAAVANSMWWYDSVFETSTTPPPVAVDNYPLVQALGAWDDHDPMNVEPFVRLLAQKMNTDDQTPGWMPVRGPFCGTYVEDLERGIRQHLTDTGLSGEYLINVVRAPTFDFVAAEVEKSQDVLLLLGFWQLQDHGAGPVWVRIGGHYVTAAGVDRPGGLIAFSDPFMDAAENGLTPGRVLGALPHLHTGPPETSHNDAQNVSHDLYEMVATNSPGGIWGPGGYAAALGPDINNFVLQNGSDQLDAEDHPVGPPFGPEPIQTEVEFAIEVSPCPAGGEDLDGDGIPDLCDNCPYGPNPGQGPAVFGQTIKARKYCSLDAALTCVVDADCPGVSTCERPAFEWPTAVKYQYAVGALPTVSGYVTVGLGTGVGNLLVVMPPASVTGAWYLLKPDCPGFGSWQTRPGAEPDRDVLLP